MNQRKNILSRKRQLLKTWGLREHPPFRGVPSGDITELMKVFVNREREMERAILTLDDGENILVRGMTGIGKTAFIMAILYQMQQEFKDLGEDVLPIHIRQFVGGTRNEFYRVILYALAKKLREIEHPDHFVDELLNLATKKYRRVIIAVDDLERCPNQGSIKLMFESSLDLIRDSRCSFILTGRTLTILEDVYSSGLDIFNETIPYHLVFPDSSFLFVEKF